MKLTLMAKESSKSLIRRLPTKWAIVAVIGLIGYAALQPAVNSRFGWHLPSVTALLGQNQADPPTNATSGSTSDSRISQTADSSGARSTDANSSNRSTGTGSTGTGSREAAATYGYLKEIGPGTYVSPAGLKYTRGSEEGHRLKHLQKHLRDIPDRPGKHGVFDGDMPQVLRWVDDAYTRSKKGGKGVKKRNEDKRTVYEVSFRKPIGYIGGRDGKREGHPEARNIRLVVEGDRLITAFPF